jgi:adenine deaminase
MMKACSWRCVKSPIYRAAWWWLALPIAGLMSVQLLAVVRRQYDQLSSAAAALGISIHDPFMALSFMALSVIPSLKLTDLGLVDVDRFELTSLFV